jgi:hypothetical protein
MRELARTNPPRFAQALLRALLDSRQKDTIAGDLLEEYLERTTQGSERVALRIWYIRQVLSFINAGSICRVLLPGAFRWIAAAAATEFVLFFVAPLVTGISAERAVFSLIGVVLVGIGAHTVRTSATRWLVFQASGVWLLPFLLAAFVTLRLPAFTPIPGVAAFFVCTAAASLHASKRTGKLSPGIGAAIVTSSSIVLFSTIATMLLHQHHPPLASFPLVLGVASIIGSVGGMFGRHFSRLSLFEPERLSITV